MFCSALCKKSKFSSSYSTFFYVLSVEFKTRGQTINVEMTFALCD